MQILKKAILPKGFKANGIACGLKKSGKLDLTLFYSDIPAKASAVFTNNKIQAAPIKVDKGHLKLNKFFHAIIVNSGNANAFTGKAGIEDAKKTAQLLADALKIKKEEVLVGSTGIIGKRLVLSKISVALPELVRGLDKHGIHQAKRAILTTDNFSKEITVKFPLGKHTISICGVAKGAGMISPDMATMLCFIFTDANIKQAALDKALRICTENTFNCITVDGCMSTNDSVIMLANGCAANNIIDENNNFNLFTQALEVVCLELAKMVVRDAEGASKFIQIKVKGAKNFKQAKTMALSIANSNLFKTATYGENPNFGRIVSALGATNSEVKEEEIKIKVSSLKKKEIVVEAIVGKGKIDATVYTSDLTPEYIRINAEYN